jgi:hypothetical protein
MKDFKLKYSWKYLLPICLFGWISCTSENEDSLSDDMETDLPICWNVESEKVQDSRALIDNSTALQTACSSGGQAIGIWSAYQWNEVFKKDVLNNGKGDVGLTYQSVSGEEAQSGWTYGDAAYWCRGAEYYFNAYYPMVGGISVVEDNTFQGLYDTETTQADIMIARNYVDTSDESFNASPVNLRMKHVLATLQFKFQLKEGSDTEKALKAFSLDNTLVTEATLNASLVGEGNAEQVALQLTNTQKATKSNIYEWTNTDGLLFTATQSASPYTTGASIYCQNEGHILILPQTCATSPTFSCLIGDKSIEGVSLNTTTFEPGKSYIYTIQMEENVLNVTLSVRPWNGLGSSYNIYF